MKTKGCCRLYIWCVDVGLGMWRLWFAEQLIDRANPVVVASAIRSVTQKLLLLAFCRQIFLWSLGAFAKLRKVSVSFVVRVCLSVRPSVCPHGTTRLSLDGFSWNFMFDYFENLSRELVSLLSVQNKGYFTWTPVYILIISRSILLRMENVLDESFREIQNTFCIQ